MARSDGSAIMPERKPVAPPSVRRPTPIPVSRTVRNLILFAIIGLLVLIVWAVPVVLVVSLGGFAAALVLSFPVHLFSRVMPRSLAILFAFLILLTVLLLAFYVLAPLQIGRAHV